MCRVSKRLGMAHLWNEKLPIHGYDVREVVIAIRNICSRIWSHYWSITNQLNFSKIVVGRSRIKKSQLFGLEMKEGGVVEMQEESCTKEACDQSPEGKLTLYENNMGSDPLLKEYPNIVREGDYFILIFADDRKTFAQAVKSQKGKSPPVKINKRSYTTSNLIGLPYGTVLELCMGSLKPLPEGEDIVPNFPAILSVEEAAPGLVSGLESEEANADDSTFPSMNPEQKNDNRNLVDNNKSQSLQFEEIEQMRQDGTHGSAIVNKLIANSSTFDQKTEFSKAKYIKKKQQKYQQRCRIVRCTPYSICETVFKNKPRLLLNMREDTLGQILSHSNVSAGCQVLVYEQCAGVITGALAWRMGGYGKILSIYDGQQPSFLEMIRRYNLSFAENFSIKWVHSGDVDRDNNTVAMSIHNNSEETDAEKIERDSLHWPCHLQNHTRGYLDSMETTREKQKFLATRCARFARKLTRQTHLESKKMLEERKSDSVRNLAR
jgi:hypothetical protein